MKGITYVTDDSHKKIAVQIDMKMLTNYDDIEDILDGIIAEARKN